jgi:hypothetical protein
MWIWNGTPPLAMADLLEIGVVPDHLTTPTHAPAVMDELCHKSREVDSGQIKLCTTPNTCFQCYQQHLQQLTPKGRSPFFWPIFRVWTGHSRCNICPKISNCWWTCGLVLALRRTNFYKIPIFGYTVMPQKYILFVMRAASGSQKTSYFLNFFGLDFFSQILNKVLKHIINLKKF